MAGYVIAYVDVHDTDGYEEYRRLVPDSIKAFGGEYVVRGGAYEVVEGSIDPKRVVVLRFESVDRAKAWWASEQYRPARDLRWKYATSNVIVVEGP
ncbi:MAG: DUF1330 domain-containing protein [Chloroflexota bacterium]